MAVDGHKGSQHRSATVEVEFLVEQRGDERLPLCIEAILETRSGMSLPVVTRDISAAGVAVEAPGLALSPEDVVRVALSMPSVMQELWLRATVAWAKGDRAGLRFLAFGPAEERLLRHVLRAVQQRG